MFSTPVIAGIDMPTPSRRRWLQHVATLLASEHESDPGLVENGRMTGTAPPGLPDGEVDLCFAEPDDGMSNEELARLNAALARGFESIQAGSFSSRG